MPVIKSRQSGSMLESAVVLDLGDLSAQSDALLKKARQQAERIVAEANEQAKAIREQAREAGRREGVEQGKAEGQPIGVAEAREQMRGEIDALCRQWQQSLQQWNEDREELLLAARDEVMRFALTVAEKIIAREIEHDPSIVRDQVGEAMALLSRPTRLAIVVNPDDRPLIEQSLGELLTSIDSSEHAELRDDGSIARGGCRIETAGGVIDATIETQLQRIGDSLVDGVNRGESQT